MDFSGVFFLVGEISMEDISTNNPMSCYKKNHGSEDGIPYQPPGKDWDLETSKVSKMGKITCDFFFRWFLTFNHGKSPGWRAVLLHPDVFSQGNDRDEHPHNKSPQKTLERSHFWSMFTNFWSYIVASQCYPGSTTTTATRQGKSFFLVENQGWYIWKSKNVYHKLYNNPNFTLQKKTVFPPYPW